jgi:hypothetical protein
VPLHQNIAAVPVNPVMGYPPGMRPRWLFPPSGDPHVSFAIPIVISLNPHMVAARWITPLFDYYSRWRDPNHKIGRRGAEGQRAGKKQSNQSRTKHDTLSLFSGTVAE